MSHTQNNLLVLATRYHSLAVDAASLPECLQAIAWTCGAHHSVALSPQEQPQQPGAVAGAGAAAGPAHDSNGVQLAQDTSANSNNGVHSIEGPGTGSSGQQHAHEVIMALAHRTLPHYGVQFHPESICTKYGLALLSNFLALAAKHCGKPWPER